MTLCPYCGSEMLPNVEGRNCLEGITSDHVFPEFLGGRRSISACRSCNSRFGHTFEGQAARLLGKVYVWLAVHGVPLPQANRWWQGACEAEGTRLDLAVGPQGVTARATRPILVHDEHARIDEAYFANGAELGRFLRTMERREPGARWEPAEKRIQTNLGGLGLQLEIGPALQQTALKMCLAASTFLPGICGRDRVRAGQILRSAAVNPHPLVSLCFYRYAAIDAARPHLAHALYVEHTGPILRGLVQFFGVLQLFCYVCSATHVEGNDAILAWVDPIDLIEQFQSIEPLGLEVPPVAFTHAELVRAQRDLELRLRNSAVGRGAPRDFAPQIRPRIEPQR